MIIPGTLPEWIIWKLSAVQAGTTHSHTLKELKRDAREDLSKDAAKMLPTALKKLQVSGKITLVNAHYQLADCKAAEKFTPKLTVRERHFVEHGTFPADKLA